MLLFGESNVYRLIRLSVTTAWRPHTSRLESQRDVAFFLFLENDESTRREEIHINFNACQLENDNDNKFPIKQGNNKFYEFLAASASSFFQTTRTHKTNTDDGCGWDVKIVFILSRFNILSLLLLLCVEVQTEQKLRWIVGNCAMTTTAASEHEHELSKEAATIVISRESQSTTTQFIILIWFSCCNCISNSQSDMDTAWERSCVWERERDGEN